MGSTVAPGFEFEDFELADHDRMLLQFPKLAEDLRSFRRFKMGIAYHWIDVALLALCFGGATAIRVVRRRKANKIRPNFTYVDVLFFGRMGLEFGILAAFGTRAYHSPLICLIFAIFAGIIVSMFLEPIKVVS